VCSLHAANFTWQSKADFDRCTTDGNIEIADDGTVHLRKSVLFEDEQGMTHYNNAQTLSSNVWAKKQFVIEDPTCDGAKLYAFNGAQAKIVCNGVELQPGKPLFTAGWTVWEVPVKALKKGLNEFVFSGNSSLLIESSLAPNRSAVSTDGGKTWDFDHLGMDGVENGEFVVRLRLAQYPKSGTITSEVVDLMETDDGIHNLLQSENLQLIVKGEAASSSSIAIELRDGRTPTPDSTWSVWKLVRQGNLRPDNGVWQRWVQWRVKLTTSQQKHIPELNMVELAPNFKPLHAARVFPKIEILELTPITIQRGSYPFAYQAPYHRLTQLRKLHKLDEVVAPGKTELEKFVLLRDWCRYSAPKGWDAGPTLWVPPWDALVILAMNKEPRALCMCTHFSTLFVQTAVALGYNARHLILDHHCAAEIWSNQFHKWIFMDTGNSTDPTLNCHFEMAGVPLNALEIRQLWKAGRTNELEVVYTPPRGRVNGSQINKNQVGFGTYRRFCIPFRNNHLVTPFPGELEEGESNYYCDAYLWWEDQAVPVESPEYSKTTCRVADFYWTLNETAISLQRSETEDMLTVTLDTVTPNFDKFLVSLDGGPWQPRPASFAWKLHSGENKLQVKSANKFGIEGIESVARVAVSANAH
jgi:hypothetical protein